MRIVFNDIDDFVSEIEAVSDEDKPVVRYLVDVSAENNDGHEVYLFCTFITDDGLICELALFCGRDMQLPNKSYDMGTIAAKSEVEKLKEKCTEFGISVRPGRYEL
jgi:hypothetical protein